MRLSAGFWFLLIFGCASPAPQHSSSSLVVVVTGFPTKTHATGYYLDDCCESCLCHGTEVLELTIEDVEILYGSGPGNVLEVEMLSGFLRTKRQSGGRHLFVLRYDSTREKYTIVEGDPIDDGRACTFEPIEDYVSGAAPYFTYGAWEAKGRHCYKVMSLSGMLASDTQQIAAPAAPDTGAGSLKR